MLLNVISGYDPDDPGSSRKPAPDFTADLNKGVAGLNIGIIRRFYTRDFEADPEMTQGIEDAAKVLSGQGAKIREIDPGPIADYISTSRLILVSEAYAIHEKWLQQRPQDYGELARERLMTGAFVRAADYIAALRQREILRKKFYACMASVDAVITASSMDPACPIEDAQQCEKIYARHARSPFNLTGNPALAVPTGFASTGLPLSMQIIGKPFDEKMVYRVARAYERETGWTALHPEMDRYLG